MGPIFPTKLKWYDYLWFVPFFYSAMIIGKMYFFLKKMMRGE